MFDFFKNRRAKESALPVSESVEAPSEALGSFANPEGQGVVGQQVGGAPAELGAVNVQGLNEQLAALSHIGPMIQKAIADGNVQISQGPSQTIDMRGSGLREQIMGIMEQHGIDPQAGTVSKDVNAADYAGMQQQILEALSQHGLDVGAMGAGGIQVQPPTDESK